MQLSNSGVIGIEATLGAALRSVLGEILGAIDGAMDPDGADESTVDGCVDIEGVTLVDGYVVSEGR